MMRAREGADDSDTFDPPDKIARVKAESLGSKLASVVKIQDSTINEGEPEDPVSYAVSNRSCHAAVTSHILDSYFYEAVDNGLHEKDVGDSVESESNVDSVESTPTN